MTLHVGPIPASALPLIYNSWIKGYWDSHTPKRGGLSYSEYCPVQHKRISAIIASKPEPIALGLCSDSSPDWVAGYLIAHGSSACLAVHWIYVKNPYRKQGYATALLDAALRQAGEPAELLCTHHVKRWEPQIERLGMRCVPMSFALDRVQQGIAP